MTRPIPTPMRHSEYRTLTPQQFSDRRARLVQILDGVRREIEALDAVVLRLESVEWVGSKRINGRREA